VEDMAAEFYGKRDADLFDFSRDLRESDNKAMQRRYAQLGKAMTKYKKLDKELNDAYGYLVRRIQSSDARVAGELVKLAKELTAGTSKTAITGNLRRILYKGYQLFWVVDASPRAYIWSFAEDADELYKLAQKESRAVNGAVGRNAWRVVDEAMLDTKRGIIYVMSDVNEKDPEAAQAAVDAGFEEANKIG